MNPKNSLPSRRTFLRQSLTAGAVLPFVYSGLASMKTPDQTTKLNIHLFSKHLQFLNIEDAAKAAADIGFDGLDLTVRPNGHVLPDKVHEDLPRAVEAMRKAGLAPSMMTTAVEDAGNNTDKRVLETASRLGFRYYRMNWFKYPEGKSIAASLPLFREKLQGLAGLNTNLKVTGCYQNHAGNLAGASLYELWEMVKTTEAHYLGVQYDIRHAVVEGGLSWQNGLRLIQPRIKTLAIKDFKWEQKNGGWAVQNTPIGEGMVDFKTYFKLLKQYQVNVPVSLHFEYPLGGAEGGGTKIFIDKQEVFNAMKRDLQKVHQLWQEA